MALPSKNHEELIHSSKSLMIDHLFLDKAKCAMSIYQKLSFLKRELLIDTSFSGWDAERSSEGRAEPLDPELHRREPDGEGAHVGGPGARGAEE